MKEYLDFSDVLIMPEAITTVDSRVRPNLYVDDVVMEKPFSIANMETTGTLRVAEIATKLGWRVYINKKTEIKEWVDYINHIDHEQLERTIPTFGVTDDDFIKAKTIYQTCVSRHGNKYRNICFDVANAHVDSFWLKIKNFLIENPHNEVIFGNFGNPRVIRYLCNFFKDVPHLDRFGIKMGIGSGSVCTTRIVTGVGAPQFTLIQESRKYVEEFNSYDKNFTKFYIISDGGCREPGDVVKAIVAGAHEVMMGGMFAGLQETGTEFYGSSSKQSSSYDASKMYATPEGKHVSVSRNTNVNNRIREIEGGVRSAMTYLGEDNIGEMIKNYNTFQIIKVNRQTSNY